MKLATFNVENLFNRPRIFDEKFKAKAGKILAAGAELSSLFEHEVYTAADKKRMLTLLGQLGLLKKDDGEFVWLRRIRGGLIKRPKSGKPEIVANGRGDWIGWLEYKTQEINEIAIDNTGRVIRDVAADVLVVVEAENRPTLSMFSKAVLERVNEEAGTSVLYNHVMVIDGNDDRGIDVGLMTRNGHSIVFMTSHVDDLDESKKKIFSRDCPEYVVRTGKGNEVVVIPNHLKSKFGGDTPEASQKRLIQAKRVAAIYKALRAKGVKHVAICGDLNDTPDSSALAPLISETDLRDVSEHSEFSTGEFEGKGTFGLGQDGNKIDYILLSPELFSKVKSAGLFRKGNWPGKKPVRWEVYPTLEKELHAASDHHLMWADIDI